jgi:hypothetical protein
MPAENYKTLVHMMSLRDRNAELEKMLADAGKDTISTVDMEAIELITRSTTAAVSTAQGEHTVTFRRGPLEKMTLDLPRLRAVVLRLYDAVLAARKRGFAEGIHHAKTHGTNYAGLHRRAQTMESRAIEAEKRLRSLEEVTEARVRGAVDALTAERVEREQRIAWEVEDRVRARLGPLRPVPIHPMDTAPRNGERVLALVRYPDGAHPAHDTPWWTCVRSAHGDAWRDDYGVAVKPITWIPLPPREPQGKEARPAPLRLDDGQRADSVAAVMYSTAFLTSHPEAVAAVATAHAKHLASTPGIEVTDVPMKIVSPATRLEEAYQALRMKLTSLREERDSLRTQLGIVEDDLVEMTKKRDRAHEDKKRWLVGMAVVHFFDLVRMAHVPLKCTRVEVAYCGSWYYGEVRESYPNHVIVVGTEAGPSHGVRFTVMRSEFAERLRVIA